MSRTVVRAGPAPLLLLLAMTGCGGPERPAPTRLRQADASVRLPTDPVPLATLLGVPPESLFAAGNERYQQEAYDSARAIWTVELRRARHAADSAAEATTLMWLGLAAWHVGDFPAARRDGEASVALKRQLGLDGRLSQSFNALGLLAWHEGRLHDALGLFDSADVSARRNHDSLGVTRARMNRPLVQLDLGDYAAARSGLRSVLAAARVTGNRRYAGNALANIAMLEIRVGNPSAALPLLAEARQQYAAGGTDYLAGEANALGQLATAWSQLGDLQRAIAAADSALGLARAQGMPHEVAATLEVLADLDLQAGSARLALRQIGQADSIDAALGLALERGINLRRSSVILLQLGEVHAAIASAEAALVAHQNGAARAEVIHDRLQLARALGEAGELDRAVREATDGIRQAAALGDLPLRREAAAVGAELALRNGDPRLALRYATDTGASSELDWMLPHLAAGALLQLGRLDLARAQAERAVTALERERGSLTLGPLRSAYLVDRVAPFSRLVRIHLARGDTARAFEVAAAVPGRALIERLGAIDDPASAVAGVAEGERVLRQVADLERRLDTLDTAPAHAQQRAALQQSLDATRAAYEEQLSHAAHLPAERLLGLGPVSLADVQRRLDPQDALLTFLSGPDRLDLFLVTRGGVLQRSAPVGARELASRVRVARQAVSTARAGAAVPAALADLNDLLTAPFAGAMQRSAVTHLVIVPHGALAALPFAALWDRTSGSFLVAKVTISYLPAVGALGGGAGGGIPLAGTVAFAPTPDSLPGTAVEVREVASLIPGAVALIGRSSTEQRVRRALIEGRPVHVASHGSRNAENPLFTRLAVGRVEGVSSDTDGQLEVHEILRMRIASPLVFLSGCETGLAAAGQEPFGRGIEEGGLAQALLVAGAGAVVATLWPVEDVSAAELARQFYRYSLQAVSPAEALARAQRNLIAEDRGLGWAAYTVWTGGARKSTTAVRTTGIRP